jgi:hypothetical protein
MGDSKEYTHLPGIVKDKNEKDKHKGELKLNLGKVYIGILNFKEIPHNIQTTVALPADKYIYMKVETSDLTQPLKLSKKLFILVF